MADTADNVSSDGAGVGGVGWGVGWDVGCGCGWDVVVKGGVVYIEAVAPGVWGLEAWFTDVDWHYGVLCCVVVWCVVLGFQVFIVKCRCRCWCCFHSLLCSHSGFHCGYRWQ